MARMEGRRFVNQTQPQTLQIAVFLLYINAFFLLVRGGFASPLGIVLIAAGVGAGFGISNEKKWGYGLGVAMSFFPLIYGYLYYGGLRGIFSDLIGLAFEIALVALLLHPQSRDYQRIWFK